MSKQKVQAHKRVDVPLVLKMVFCVQPIFSKLQVLAVTSLIIAMILNQCRALPPTKIFLDAIKIWAQMVVIHLICPGREQAQSHCCQLLPNSKF